MSESLQITDYLGTIWCPNDYQKPPCERQYAEFQSIYTWFLLTGSFSGIILDPVHQLYGNFITRLIMGTATTSGIIFVIFYEENPYLIWVAWQLMGLSSIMYIIVNIKELCAIFPKIEPLCIGLVNGLFDASAGLFLIFKFLYDSTFKISMKTMLIFYAGCSIVIWIKTLFLSAYRLAPRNTDNSYSVFDDSPIGRLFNRKSNERNVSWIDALLINLYYTQNEIINVLD